MDSYVVFITILLVAFGILVTWMTFSIVKTNEETGISSPDNSIIYRYRYVILTAVVFGTIVILYLMSNSVISTSAKSLSLLQQDVQKYMDDMDECVMHKVWWKNQEGTVYLEVPEQSELCGPTGYLGQVSRAYSRCLDSVGTKWLFHGDIQPSSNMTWDKLKSEIIKCVPQYDCDPICYTGEPIPPPPL